MAGKKHSPEEMAAMMTRANEMAARGKSARDICASLGVSIMTLHRWRKKSADALSGREGSGNSEREPRMAGDVGSSARIGRLELENAQLREIVADLLLEKRKIEEELRTGEARFLLANPNN